MTTQAQVETWSEAYRAAWESRDPDAASALFSEDATYRDLVYDDPHHGRDGVYAYWAGVTEGQSEVTVRMGSPVVSGSRATVEFWTTMKAGGDPVTLAGILILDFDEGGLCAALREYWNVSEGTIEPPEGWGS